CMFSKPPPSATRPRLRCPSICPSGAALASRCGIGEMRQEQAVHCRICSQLQPYIRANAVRAFGDRAGVSVASGPRLVPPIMRGPLTPLTPGHASVKESVSMRVVLCVPVISAGMIGAVLAIGSSPAVADCLPEPNRDAPPGQHWYFRVDHAN